MDKATTSRRASSTPDVPWVRVKVRYRDAVIFLTLRGEADAHTSTRLQDDLMRALRPRSAAVVLDLAGLSFVDLAGMRTLHEFAERAARRGTPVDIRNMSSGQAWLYDLAFPADARRAGAGARSAGRSGDDAH